MPPFFGVSARRLRAFLILTGIIGVEEQGAEFVNGLGGLGLLHHDFDFVQPVQIGRRNGLGPLIKRKFIAAISLGFAVHEGSAGAQGLNLSRGEKRGGRLQFGILAGTERGGNALRQAGQRHAQDEDRAHDLDQGKSGVGTALLHWRSSSMICTRDVIGLTRKARPKPARSRSSTSRLSAVPSAKKLTVSDEDSVSPGSST